MTDVYAAWAADHALLLFIALPFLSGAGALLFARGCLRWSPRRRAACFALGTCASFALFFVLAYAVGRPGAVVAFDRALAAALSMSMSMPLLWLLSWFTYLGDRTFLTIIAVLMTLFLLWGRQWRLSVTCAVATGLERNWLLKHSFRQVRPDHDHGYATAVAGVSPAATRRPPWPVYSRPAIYYGSWRRRHGGCRPNRDAGGAHHGDRTQPHPAAGPFRQRRGRGFRRQPGLAGGVRRGGSALARLRRRAPAPAIGALPRRRPPRLPEGGAQV